MRIKVNVFFSILALFLAPQCFAESLELGLGIDISAGVDRKTRKWVDSLPEKVRIEAIKMLEQALPLVDKSVNGYLDRVEEIMSSTISDAGCQAQAFGKGTIDFLGSAITFSGMPRPINDLKKEKKAYKKRFDRDTSPTLYADDYADLVANISLTRCQLLHSPDAVSRVDLIMEDVLPLFQLWTRLEEENCTSAENCLEQKLKSIKDMGQRADIRDVAASEYERIISSVHHPKVSSFRQFRPGPYEVALIKIYRAEDALMLAKFRRISLARMHLDAADDKLSSLNYQYKTAYDDLNKNPKRSSDSANHAAVNLVAVNALIDKAEETAVELKEQVDLQRNRAAAMRRKLEELKNIADNNIRQIHDKRIDSRVTGGERGGAIR
jgi:flagellar biosynthesis chaperone FliJ